MYTHCITCEVMGDDVEILDVIQKRRVVQPERIGRQVFRLKHDLVQYNTPMGGMSRDHALRRHHQSP